MLGNAALKVTVAFLGVPENEVLVTAPAFVSNPPPAPPVIVIDPV